jgi:hypothetical protein
VYSVLVVMWPGPSIQHMEGYLQGGDNIHHTFILSPPWRYPSSCSLDGPIHISIIIYFMLYQVQGLIMKTSIFQSHILKTSFLILANLITKHGIWICNWIYWIFIRGHRPHMLQAQPSAERNGETPLGCSGRTALRREQCDVIAPCGSW